MVLLTAKLPVVTVLMLFLCISGLALLIFAAVYKRITLLLGSISLTAFPTVVLLFLVTFSTNKAIDESRTFNYKFKTTITGSFQALYVQFNEKPRDLIINEKNPNIARLRQMVPYQYIYSADPDFFNYYGLRDWYRMPITYPYSIYCYEDLSAGYLYYELDVKEPGTETGEPLNLKNIIRFSFDKNFLLAEVIDDDYFTDASATKKVFYYFLDFSNGESKKFLHKEDMYRTASAYGFVPAFNMMTPAEFYNLLQ